MFYTASDLRRVLDDSLFMSCDYNVGRYYYHDGLRRSKSDDFGTTSEQVNLTEKNGKVEMTFSTNDFSTYSFTNPVVVRSRGVTKVYAERMYMRQKTWMFVQPTVVEIVRPYTRPENVFVESTRARMSGRTAIGCWVRSMEPARS